ncbi:hypothetical protein TRFO_10422 [Tritrichomonas foetus]|uniref:Uncharacterized protein n=1 Tax=Tritrichomonas foetus TaxID=1144522 RepID=A0A1J4JE56_9EUKA|nr:hypothetical protein TRFO_10422 [Tritrichomonas foetus]|eukprot:OHS95540.1 hypothetical protein TRFO_10422 [Tritrichomonas foetus]
MLGEEEDEEADNHQFFDDVREKHKVLIDLQKDLHEDVVDVENKWANVRTLSAIHKQYHSAVSFFQEKEIKLQAMAEKMQNLTDTIAMLPEKT